MFITLEGIDGSGKSTQGRLLESYLISKGHDLVCTREPGGTATSNKIREILMMDELCLTAEILLFLAARAEHERNIITPALQSGKTVLCDRFLHSTLAYQVFARGEQVAFFHLVHYQFVENHPSYVFILDIEPEIAMERCQVRGSDLTIIEQRKLEFFRRVRESYLLLPKVCPSTGCSRSGKQWETEINIVDGGKTIAEVHISIVSILEKGG